MSGNMFKHLSGIYAAAITPLNEDRSLALGDVVPLLDFLASRGCHGALLFGTTGEGPSFSPEERLNLLGKAVEIKGIYPDFQLLAGTGTPSLTETKKLTRTALELGVDGVVVLPPYYYKGTSEDGLFAWFEYLLESSVSPGEALFAYHIPALSGVGISIELLVRLKESFPDRFAGVKDSSGDPQHAQELGEMLGSDLLIMTGNDRLLSLCLEHAGSGCITALANLYSIDSRRVWDAYQRGEKDQTTQIHLNSARSVLERYPPAPPLLKALYTRWFDFPHWTLMPPLQELPEEIEAKAASDFNALE